jgi:hypothetical protein
MRSISFTLVLRLESRQGQFPSMIPEVQNMGRCRVPCRRHLGSGTYSNNCVTPEASASAVGCPQPIESGEMLPHGEGASQDQFICELSTCSCPVPLVLAAVLRVGDGGRSGAGAIASRRR